MMTEEKFTEIVGQLVDLHERFAAYRRREFDDRRTEDALFVDFGSLVQAAVDLSELSTVTAGSQSTTPSDRVADMLHADPQRSDRDIARTVGCSPTSVGRLRRELDLVQKERRVERNGHVYSMKVADPPLPDRNDQRALLEALDGNHAPTTRETTPAQPVYVERVVLIKSPRARAPKVFYLDDC